MYEPSSNLCVRVCVVCIKHVSVQLWYIIRYFWSVPQLNSGGQPEHAAVYWQNAFCKETRLRVWLCFVHVSVLFFCLFFTHHMGSRTPSSEDLALISVEWILSGKVWLAFCKETRLRVWPCFVHVSALFCFYWPSRGQPHTVFGGFSSNFSRVGYCRALSI